MTKFTAKLEPIGRDESLKKTQQRMPFQCFRAVPLTDTIHGDDERQLG